MLRCESSDCHAFHSISYILFRSGAVSHVQQPGEYLQDGARHRFADTEVVVEIERVHPEGVLEVVCYFEYET